jgi:hypothetical protein
VAGNNRVWSKQALVAGLALSMAACTGSIGDAPGQGDGPSAETLSEIRVSGLRRLTAIEYDATVFDLLGVVVTSETALPEDLRTPYDNDYTKQQVSESPSRWRPIRPCATR